MANHHKSFPPNFVKHFLLINNIAISEKLRPINKMVVVPLGFPDSGERELAQNEAGAASGEYFPFDMQPPFCESSKVTVFGLCVLVPLLPDEFQRMVPKRSPWSLPPG